MIWDAGLSNVWGAGCRVFFVISSFCVFEDWLVGFFFEVVCFWF